MKKKQKKQKPPTPNVRPKELGIEHVNREGGTRVLPTDRYDPNGEKP